MSYQLVIIDVFACIFIGYLIVFSLMKKKSKKRVYFIQAENGSIKIGTSIDIKNRMSCLFKEVPISLVLLYSFPGSFKEERALHQALDQYRIKGEWFRPCEEVKQTIEKLRTGIPFETVIDDLFNNKFIKAGVFTKKDIYRNKEAKKIVEDTELFINSN